MRRALYASMREVEMASASELSCSSEYMRLSSVKTRSHEAELGDSANTMRAASAHAGNLLPLTRINYLTVTLS